MESILFVRSKYKMSAGTSGILPSATYASADGANSAVGADPLWLSTNGGAVNGPTTLTGPLSMPNGIATYPSVPFTAPGTAGYITFGTIRFFWAQQTTGTDGSVTTTLPPFVGLNTVTAIPQNSDNVLCEYNVSNPAAGTVRVVCVDSVAPHAPSGAGIPVQLFGCVTIAAPAPA